MKHFDTAIIGGGILGCFAARNLSRWKLSCVLIEAAADVCTGITRANSAIVYAGYDNKSGSLKAKMTVQASEGFDALCRELEVPFSRCGSLLVSFGPNGDRTLRKKLEQGQANGVAGLRLLSGKEAQALEPTLSPDVTCALHAPTTGTVNPWQLGIAAYENAVQNGCTPMLNSKVLRIQKETTGYRIETSKGAVFCKTILNCAGVDSVQIQQMVFPTPVQLRLDGTDYLVLDKDAPAPHHIIFHESEDGKGITAVPCVEGNLLLESSARPLGEPYATTRAGMEFIKTTVAAVLPGTDLNQVIRSFGAVRPNPHVESGKSIHDFCIEQPAPDFISLIGIKTPGLTCANELGCHLAAKIAAYLGASPNPRFDPHRKAITQEDHDIVCQCEQITRGQVLEAIHRGAATVEAVKRRVGSGMGRCQGSRCSWQIEKLLEECEHGIL